MGAGLEDARTNHIAPEEGNGLPPYLDQVCGDSVGGSPGTVPLLCFIVWGRFGLVGPRTVVRVALDL